MYDCRDSVQKCSVSFDGYEISEITDVMEDEVVSIDEVLEFRSFEFEANQN